MMFLRHQCMFPCSPSSEHEVERKGFSVLSCPLFFETSKYLFLEYCVYTHSQNLIKTKNMLTIYNGFLLVSPHLFRNRPPSCGIVVI